MNKLNFLYDIEIKRLVLLLLPIWLRRPIATALLYAGVTPVCRILNELRSFRLNMGRRLCHSGQVCRLRGLLNDEFDPVSRRIRVADEWAAGSRGELLYCRQTGRGRLLMRRAQGRLMIINRRGYSGASGYDFHVILPWELHGEVDETRLTALVNMYKLASRRWRVGYE